MRKLVLSLLAAGLVINTGKAQTLFSFGNTNVTKQEFLRNYQKNSINKKPDMSETALREYINLYSLFRMKVKEAETMKIDTMSSIMRELDNYKKQLAKNYLTDEEVNNRLYREAYDRMKEDRHVAHILLMAPPNLNAQDSLAAYKKLDSLYKLITTKKADFAVLAKEFSEDKGTKDRGGDIGFMTSLQTLYPFENAVYSTEVGKVSKPFRTALGFHIVKVIEKRPTRGEVQVAQIMLATPKSRGKEGIDAAMKKIDTIKAALKSGTSYEKLVEKYSEDNYTNKQGGVMPKFGVGKVWPEYEAAAFALKNPGDISEPVQTEYGFHILKLIKKIPMQPYDSMVASIKKLVENDARAQTAKDIYYAKIKSQNGFKDFPANYDELVARIAKIPDTGAQANTFSATDFDKMNKPLFTLANVNYMQSDMMLYAENLTRGRIMGPRQSVAKDIYNMYLNNVITNFQENKLLEENEDFRNLMMEYHDGIMLFELMDQQVWGKASKDSVGLRSFYEANKTKYMWEPGFVGSVYRFKDEASMKKGLSIINKKSSKDEDVSKAVNNEENPDAVTIQQGRYEFSRFKDVPKEVILKGKPYTAVKNADGSYTVVKPTSVSEGPSQKSLEDAKGYVVAEYQDFLEKKWNEKLRNKYPVKVDETVFNTLNQK